MNKQSGSALPLIVIVIIVILVGIGITIALGGFFFFKGASKLSENLKNNPLTDQVNSKIIETQCELKDKNMCKYFANLVKATDYSIEMTTTSAGVVSKSLLEVVGSDKSHIVVYDDGKESYNIITMGESTYTKDIKSGIWYKKTEKSTESEKPEMTEFSKNEMMQDLSAFSTDDYKVDYKYIAKEACGKFNCFKYEVVDDDPESSQLIWFDDREFLTRKMKIDGGGSVTTSEYSYDNIKINAPSPVKELKEGEMVMPGGGVYSLDESAKQYEDDLKKIQEQYDQEFSGDYDYDQESFWEE